MTAEQRGAEVPEALHGERIDRVVAIIANLTRSEASEAVDAGAVSVNGTVVLRRSSKVHLGDQIDVMVVPPVAAAPLAGDESVEFATVYADDDVIVVNKPAGLVVHPGAGNANGTLVHGLLARYPDLFGLVEAQAERPGIVHRIDKGTSGLLMVARTPRAVAGLIAQLAARTVTRQYIALSHGHLDARTGVIDAPIGRSDSDPTRMAVSAHGRNAVTHYSVAEVFTSPDLVSLVTCRLETGRTHQIRVHLAAIGHPVVGDERYGGVRGRVQSPRAFLHAAHLGFEHPSTGDWMTFDAELPPDLVAVRDQLR